jgi:hypothetical protein
MMMALLTTAPAFAATQAVPLETVLTTQLDGQITIDPQGRTADYTIDTPVSDALKNKLGEIIRGWEFEPVVIDGKPVTASASMRLSLVGFQDGAAIRVGIDNVTFPDADGVGSDEPPPVELKSQKMTPPDYPSDNFHSGLEGRVLLYVRVAPDGRVADVAAGQSGLYNPQRELSDKTLAKGLSRFESAALKAARAWKFEVKVNAQQTTDDDFTIHVPVEFHLSHLGAWVGPGRWYHQVRTPSRPAPWLAQPPVQRVGVGDVVGGEILPLASALKLKTPLPAAAL